MPVFDSTQAIEVARTDDLFFDVTLEETSATTGATAALTSGLVTGHVSLWPPSLTPISGTDDTLTHTSAGRWIGSRDKTQMTTAFASLRDGTRIAIVYVVDGAMARYREATLVPMRRVEV